MLSTFFVHGPQALYCKILFLTACKKEAFLTLATMRKVIYFLITVSSKSILNLLAELGTAEVMGNQPDKY